MAQIVMWVLFIGPWLLLFAVDKERVKRYMAVSLFGVVLLTVVFQIADHFNYETLFFFVNMTPFPFGIFIIGTLFIFYFTYPGFWMFMIINAAFDLFQAFVMSPIFEKLDIYTLKGMNHFLLFVLMMVIAVLLFLYQKWQDTAFKLSIK
ncbi:hypothetical protein [Priestia megaterium]